MDDLQNATRQPVATIPPMSMVSLGLLLVAGILGAVSLGVAWVDFEGNLNAPNFGFGGGSVEFQGAFSAFSLEVAGESTEYTNRDMDDTEGIGMMRAAGPLLVIGTSLAFVALVLGVLDLFVAQRGLDIASTASSAAGFFALIAGTILLPMGIASAVRDFFGGQATASFVAGLFLAGAACVLTLAATVTTLVGSLQARNAASTDA